MYIATVTRTGPKVGLSEAVTVGGKALKGSEQ